MREARFVGGGSWHSKWSVLATLVRGILLNLSVLVLHRTLVIKSRRSLSVKMKETMGSFCCSCVESVTFGYPQHLWNSCHLDYEKSFFSWSIAKVPSYMITTSISSFYSPFLPLWMHMPCSCQSSCPEEGKPLHKKGLWMHTNLLPPSPSSVWQSKTTSWQSSKVKQNVTFHHQSWGIVCGECYPWLLTPYHSCHHLSIIL